MHRNSLLFLSCLILTIGCNLPPKHAMIEQAYFKCEKCDSIQGGIYGKGPVKLLDSDKAQTCFHKWQRIDRTEFKKLGIDWFNINWEQEGFNWAR